MTDQIQDQAQAVEDDDVNPIFDGAYSALMEEIIIVSFDTLDEHGVTDKEVRNRVVDAALESVMGPSDGSAPESFYTMLDIVINVAQAAARAAVGPSAKAATELAIRSEAAKSAATTSTRGTKSRTARPSTKSDATDKPGRRIRPS